MKRWILVLLALLLFLLSGCAEAPEIPQQPAAPVEKTAEDPAAVIEPESPAGPAEKKQEAEADPEEAQPQKEEPTPEPAVKSAAAVPQSELRQSTPKAAVPSAPSEPQEPEQTPAQTAVQEPEPSQPAAVERTPSEPEKPSEPTPKPEVHTHSYTATVVEPTCTEWGYTKHICACGDQYKDGCTKPLGHDYQQTGHADATYSSEGYNEYTCSRCGASYRETISQLVRTGATAADAQSACNAVNDYICGHYRLTDNRGTYTGVTWIEQPSDVSGAVQSVIGTVELYAQYYSAQSFYCGYWESGGSYTLVLYWDTV